MSRQRQKLPPVPVLHVSVGQYSPFQDMTPLHSSFNSKGRGPSARERDLTVNQLLHDREAEPRSRHQLRALAKMRVVDNASGSRAASVKSSRSETPTSVRVQLAPLQRQASLQRGDRDESESRSNNNAHDSIIEAAAREVSTMIAQLKPPTQQSPPSVTTKRSDEVREPRPAAVPPSEAWQAGSTTLARYRRLVGAVARRSLTTIVSQAAQNVVAQRDREHRCALLLQRHVLALLVRRRDLHHRERAATVLQRWIRVCQWLRRVEIKRRAAELERLREIEVAQDTAAISIQRLYASYQVAQQRRQSAIELARLKEVQEERLRQACRALVARRRSQIDESRVRAAELADSTQGSDRLSDDSTHIPPTLRSPTETDRLGEGLLDRIDRACDVEADLWPRSTVPVSSDAMDEARILATYDLQLASCACESTPAESKVTVDLLILREAVSVNHDGVESPLDRSVSTKVTKTATDPPNIVITEPVNVDFGRSSWASSYHEEPTAYPTNSVTLSVASTATDCTAFTSNAPWTGHALLPPIESSTSPIVANADDLLIIETTSCPFEPSKLVDFHTQYASALIVIGRLVVPAVSQRRILRLTAITRIQRATRGFLARQHEREALEAELSELRVELARSWVEMLAVDIKDAAPAPRHLPAHFSGVTGSDGDSDSDDTDNGDSSTDMDHQCPAEALECAFLSTRDGLLPSGVHLATNRGPRGRGHVDGRGLMSLWWWHWLSETWEAAMPQR
jgi:hypothetical protein